MMIALLAKLNVAAGKEREFESAMLELAAQVRANEPGNQLYTLVKDEDGYAVMELYADEAALEVLSSIKRAGADIIVTYFAERAAALLGEGR